MTDNMNFKTEIDSDFVEIFVGDRKGTSKEKKHLIDKSYKVIDEKPIIFDIEKIEKINNFKERRLKGLTLIMGGPFEDKSFRFFLYGIGGELKNIFKKYDLEDILVLYDLDDIHATFIGLEGKLSQDKENELIKEDLQINLCSNKQMNLDYVLEFVEKYKPFEVELGSRDRSDLDGTCVMNILENGLIIVFGRPKKKGLLKGFRQEFNVKANIKYAHESDTFFCVLGYLKSDKRLFGNESFNIELKNYLIKKKKEIELSVMIYNLRLVLYEKTTLAKEFRLKQLDLEFGKKCSIKEGVLDYFIKDNRF